MVSLLNNEDETTKKKKTYALKKSKGDTILKTNIDNG